MKDLTTLTIFGPEKSEILILEDYNESELTFYGNFLFKLSSPQHFEGSYKFVGHLFISQDMGDFIRDRLIGIFEKSEINMN